MARYDAAHKAATRRRILDSAARRFKQDGINGAGVALLMSEAGLTNGAFYAHFTSKDDLVAHVVADQLHGQRATLAALPPGRDALMGFVREYLSPAHRDQPATGCPSAALLDEIGRSSRAVRDAYTHGVQAIIDQIAAHLAVGDAAAGRTAATGLATLMVGTLQLARAMADTDVDASDGVLEAGIVNAQSLLRAL